jgi:hypothetical protein
VNQRGHEFLSQPNFTITGTSSGSGLEEEEAEDYFDGVDEDDETETETEIPASPTPGPRPGSAMSMMSRRSQTPTVTMSYGTFGTLPSSGSLNAGSGTMHRRNSGSYLTVPSVYPEPIPPVPTPTLSTVAPQSPGRVRAAVLETRRKIRSPTTFSISWTGGTRSLWKTFRGFTKG